MPKSRECAHCGAPRVEVDARLGLCPSCLLRAGRGPEEKHRRHPRHYPLPPEALARYFPAYDILGVAGCGGMGAVYRARQKKLDRLVALKVLHPELAREVSFAERFAREARMLAQLQHPGIVGIHDFGETHGLYYLVLGFVQGEDLRALIDRGTLTVADSLDIARQICAALGHAHALGVIHRDIKPENILVDAEGRARLTDFGLAKLTERDGRPASLTETHRLLGTVDYVALERWSSPRGSDPRSDLYSLAVVIYEMLAGEVPLGRFEPPSRHAPVGRRVDEAILRALSRDPKRRFGSASAFARELQDEGHERLGSYPVGEPLRRAPMPRAEAGRRSEGEVGEAQRPTSTSWSMIFWAALALVASALPWARWELPGMSFEVDAFGSSVDLLGFAVPNESLLVVFGVLVVLAHARARGQRPSRAASWTLVLYGLVHLASFAGQASSAPRTSLGLGFGLTAAAFVAAGVHSGRPESARRDRYRFGSARVPTPQELM